VKLSESLSVSGSKAREERIGKERRVKREREKEVKEGEERRGKGKRVAVGSRR
jgi:hypothetical protein